MRRLIKKGNLKKGKEEWTAAKAQCSRFGRKVGVFISTMYLANRDMTEISIRINDGGIDHCPLISSSTQAMAARTSSHEVPDCRSLAPCTCSFARHLMHSALSIRAFYE
jgi:hypothetical protein